MTFEPLDIDHREFGIYEDIDLADPAALKAEVARFNARVREFNLDVHRLNDAVDGYNSACASLDGAFARAEASRANIADHAQRLVQFADGTGGGELLPFLE